MTSDANGAAQAVNAGEDTTHAANDNSTSVENGSGGPECSPSRFAADAPFDDPGRDLHWADSGNYGIESKWWKKRKGSHSKLYEQCLSKHEEQNQKDGRAFFPGELSGDRCIAANVAHVDLMIADVDATDADEINTVMSAIDAAELGCDMHSTFNHGVSHTEVKHEDYEGFCRQHDLDTLSPEAASRYLLEVKGYRPDVVANAQVKEACAQSKVGLGTVVVLGHAPLIKLRLVFTLDRPYSPTDMVKLGFSNDDARGRLWVAGQRNLFSALGIPFDGATTDVARRFYVAARRPDVAPFSKRIPGKAVRLDAILPKSVSELDAVIPPKSKRAERPGAKAKAKSEGKSDDFIFQGFKLKPWAVPYAPTFKIEELFAARGLALGERSGGGCFAQCHQEDRHSSPNPPRTFVVNGNGDKGFALHCSGGTDGCCDLDRLQHLKRYLEAGLITLDDLQNREFGGGPQPARGQRERVRSAPRRDLRVIDSNGRGIDVAIFHASMIARPGLLDFAKLSEVSGKQIASDVSAKQLAAFIEDGHVTVEHLTECVICEPSESAEEPSDPYQGALNALAWRKLREKMLDTAINRELDVLVAKFSRKLKDVKLDFARTCESVPDPSASPGFLSAEESDLVRPFRDLADQFAFLGQGGNGYILDMLQPDVSKAVMSTEGFELLHRDQWFIGADGQVVYPAKCYLAKPPHSAQFYRGGLVFEPSATVGADQYNLYRGLLIEPDASGSCDLFKELLRDVWAHGDQIIYEWVLEWFMHIIAFPGEKVSTSIAIRGDYADGKSFPTERAMSAILGDMLMRVADQNAVLGDFNEALIGKLMIVLEEAAFAGDKAAFDRLKELVTGPTISINQKFKSRFTVRNHARMMLVSNHEHFMHIKPKDRRYAVLESSSAWNGNTKKFAETIDQWNNGGAARFVHDAINHSFRRFDDSRQLVINTNLKTQAAVDQMALSRSPLEKCIVSLLVRGNFTSPKDRMVILDNTDSDVMTKTHLWTFTEEWKITSDNLEDAVTVWLRDFDPKAAQREASLHLIMRTLEKYVGKTKQSRPKIKRNGQWGQGPTVRLLPSRLEALKHAQPLLTTEELEASGLTAFEAHQEAAKANASDQEAA